MSVGQGTWSKRHWGLAPTNQATWGGLRALKSQGLSNPDLE
jgi:hypothetical protein